MIVLGGGIVGVSTALSLQNRGCAVTLIDRTPSVRETSYGNAGVFTLGSIVPFNNPALVPQLIPLLANRANGFRYSAPYMLSQAHHLAQFLWHARKNDTAHRINALHQLIVASKALHKSWLSEAGGLNHLRENGWLQLYRSEKSFQISDFLRRVLDEFGINFNIVEPKDISDLEPDITPFAHKGILINDASSVDNPGDVVELYRTRFIQKGGEFLHGEAHVAELTSNDQWSLTLNENRTVNGNHLVIALGPWSKSFIAKLGLKLPMIFERGSHREYQTASGKHLSRPVYDVAGGYVATPMTAGIRVTCGVELNAQNAKPSSVQIDIAERIARQSFPIADQTGDTWHGCRPTVPDSMPLIGQTRHKGLWLNTAHQHIGFATGPISGEILASLMTNQSSPIESPTVFSPSRYGL